MNLEEIKQSLFKRTGKTKVIDKEMYAWMQAIGTMKQLPDEQLAAFVVSLAIRAQEQNSFKDYPYPNLMARKFALEHFKGGKP